MNMPSRRTIVAALSSLATATSWSRAVAQVGGPGPFRVDALPYAPNALEPYIDQQTMSLHHDKHHAAYVNNLNVVAKDVPQIAQVPMQIVLADLNAVPEAVRTTVRNNMGGHVNHTMYWQIMGPNGGAPGGELLAAIERDFGGVGQLQAAFESAGGRVFGSGWVFVTVTRDGKLALEARPNQDTPLMEGKRVLFGNDVWEHAYYLKYQNRRADYMKAWWNTVNWAKLTDRFNQAKVGALTI